MGRRREKSVKKQKKATKTKREVRILPAMTATTTTSGNVEKMTAVTKSIASAGKRMATTRRPERKQRMTAAMTRKIRTGIKGRRKRRIRMETKRRPRRRRPKRRRRERRDETIVRIPASSRGKKR